MSFIDGGARERGGSLRGKRGTHDTYGPLEVGEYRPRADLPVTVVFGQL